MIAAFLMLLSSFRRPFAHAAIFDIPRSTMFEAGAENGRLSLEVMRFNLNLRFFFPTDVPPSTSASGRLLLNDFGARLVQLILSKQNWRGGKAVKVNAMDLASQLLKRNRTMLTYRLSMQLSNSACLSACTNVTQLQRRLHLLDIERVLESTRSFACYFDFPSVRQRERH